MAMGRRAESGWDIDHAPPCCSIRSTVHYIAELDGSFILDATYGGFGRDLLESYDPAERTRSRELGRNSMASAFGELRSASIDAMTGNGPTLTNFRRGGASIASRRLGNGNANTPNLAITEIRLLGRWPRRSGDFGLPKRSAHRDVRCKEKSSAAAIQGAGRWGVGKWAHPRAVLFLRPISAKRGSGNLSRYTRSRRTYRLDITVRATWREILLLPPRKQK